MKIYNLTDIPTPRLEQYGFVRQAFVVARVFVAPGESAEVADEPIARMALEHLVAAGAAAVGELPPTYVAAKHLPRPSADPLIAPPVAIVEPDVLSPAEGEPERPAPTAPSAKSKRGG